MNKFSSCFGPQVLKFKTVSGKCFSKMANHLILWMDILATTTFNKRKHQLKRKMIDTYISFRHIRHRTIDVRPGSNFIYLTCLLIFLFTCRLLFGWHFSSSSCKYACQRAVNISSTRETEKKSNEIVVFVLNLEMVWVDLVTYILTLSKSIFGCLENRRGFISNLAGVTSALTFCHIHIALFLILNELILSMVHNVMHGILSNIDNHQSECLSKCLVIDESRIQHQNYKHHPCI